MEIIIYDHETIGEVQEKFQKEFPFLKLEFFSTAHESKVFYDSKHLVSDTSKTIGELRQWHNIERINLSRDRKVGDVEHDFRVKLGLYVQVFRRSGEKWLKTTATDNWTLDKQDEAGKESAILVAGESPADSDYQEHI